MSTPSLSQLIRAQLESASSPLSTRTLARRIGARPRRVLAALRAGAGERVAYQDVGCGKSSGCVWALDV